MWSLDANSDHLSSPSHFYKGWGDLAWDPFRGCQGTWSLTLHTAACISQAAFMTQRNVPSKVYASIFYLCSLVSTTQH